MSQLRQNSRTARQTRITASPALGRVLGYAETLAFGLAVLFTAAVVFGLVG